MLSGGNLESLGQGQKNLNYEPCVEEVKRLVEVKGNCMLKLSWRFKIKEIMEEVGISKRFRGSK